MNRVWILVASLCTSLAVHGATVEEGLYGSWKVDAAVDSQDTASISSDDVDRLTGKQLLITSKLVQFDDETCEKPQFKTSRKRTARMFRQDYRFSPKYTGLPDPVVEVKVSCANPVDYFIYLKNKSTIVFYWKGFFLSAVRQQATKPSHPMTDFGRP